MKLKSCIASALAAAITLSSASLLSFSNAAESTEPTVYTLTYNVSDDGFTAEDMTLYETIQVEAGDYVIIPDQDVTSSVTEFKSSGWTDDGIFVYEPGDYYTMPDHDVTLEPVWIDNSDVEYSVTYNYKGDDYVVLNEKPFLGWDYYPGSAVPVISSKIMRDGYTQIGWLYNDGYYTDANKMIMPANDVVFEPKWYQNFDVYYESGDVDRINGTSTFIYERYETLVFDLANASKISRSGFNLTGWYCDFDQQVYKPGAQYTMPASEVHFTAVWTPKDYTVVFKSNNGKNETIKITGATDTVIVAPECTFTNGNLYFAGWDYEGTVYQAGEDFLIPGALPGLGIALTAVWSEEPLLTAGVMGDADENGLVELNDAVLIMSNIVDPEAYPISAQGQLNADVYQNGDGLSNMDALSIQKYLAQLISELPESYMVTE